MSHPLKWLLFKKTMTSGGGDAQKLGNLTHCSGEQNDAGVMEKFVVPQKIRIIV